MDPAVHYATYIRAAVRVRSSDSIRGVAGHGCREPVIRAASSSPDSAAPQHVAGGPHRRDFRRTMKFGPGSAVGPQLIDTTGKAGTADRFFNRLVGNEFRTSEAVSLMTEGRP